MPSSASSSFDKRSDGSVRKSSNTKRATSPKSSRRKSETQNYSIEFPGVKDACRVIVDNKTYLDAHVFDTASGEEVTFYFGLITKRDPDGDLKLSKMCFSMEEACVHHHTYNAKSRKEDFRITRVGCTKLRLEAFAEGNKYEVGLSEISVKEECAKFGLILENPETSKGDGGGQASYYPPYSEMSAPFRVDKKYLYESLTAGDLLKLCKRLLMDPVKGCGFDFHRLASNERDNAFCEAFFPLHDKGMKKALKEAWMPLDWPWKLPVWGIKEYFGEEVRFYFAFLAHLTSFLVPLAPFAVAASIPSAAVLLDPASSTPKHMYTEALVSIFGTCYYAMVVDAWRYQESTTAHLWSVFGCTDNLPPRPGFKGAMLKNPSTGKMEIDFPASLRAPRSRLSTLATSAMIAVLVPTVISIFAYKTILARNPSSTPFELMLPALLNSIQITIFGAVYKEVAKILTNFENHKTLTEHNAELFKKLTFFYFINHYVSLFYIAFLKGSLEQCVEPFSTDKSKFCGFELGYQVANVFVVNDLLARMAASTVYPALSRWVKHLQHQHDSSMKYELMGPVEWQFRTLSLYDPTRDLVLDYMELYIQWGYLTLFGAACPVVIALACFTNFLETRTDGLKLFSDFRRVVPNRVAGVGKPLAVFKWTVYLAVPVNAGLVVYCFGAVRYLPESSFIWVFVALMAAMALLILLLESIFPEVPLATRMQIERQKVVFEKVVCEKEDEDDDDEGRDEEKFTMKERIDLEEEMIGKSVKEWKAQTQSSSGAGVHRRKPPTVTESTVLARNAPPQSYTSINPKKGATSATHGGVVENGGNPLPDSANSAKTKRGSK